MRLTSEMSIDKRREESTEWALGHCQALGLGKENQQRRNKTGKDGPVMKEENWDDMV